MSIIYYPTESFKQRRHVVEQLQQPNLLYSAAGQQDIQDSDMDAAVWSPRSWEVKRVSLQFSAADNKDYSVSVVRGIGVVAGKNDRLWVRVPSVVAQAIIVPQGFYDQTTMASALKTALDASALPSTSKPFTVTFGSNAFTITPTTGTVAVLATNPGVNVRSNSTLAPSLGFTVNTVQAASVTGDTTVPGLGAEMIIVQASGSSNLDITVTDVIAMNVDNMLLVSASSATPSVTAFYEVTYRILDA